MRRNLESKRRHTRRWSTNYRSPINTGQLNTKKSLRKLSSSRKLSRNRRSHFGEDERSSTPCAIDCNKKNANTVRLRLHRDPAEGFE
jgi:hypothetical protein